MNRINNWLKEFKTHWENHNITNILNLFDKNVIYYETPFYKLDNFEQLSKEWQYILKQKNINLDYEIFLKDNNKYAVIWDLKYLDNKNIKQHFKGTYLIKLNDKNLCTYFHHSCESEN